MSEHVPQDEHRKIRREQRLAEALRDNLKRRKASRPNAGQASASKPELSNEGGA